MSHGTRSGDLLDEPPRTRPLLRRLRALLRRIAGR